jgi:uroporphyrinogen decarboxylase
MDRIPAAPLLLNHPARVLGVPIKKTNTDGQMLGKAHVAAYRKYGQDFITILTCTANVSEAMGAKLSFPDDDVAMLDEPGMKTLEQVDDLRPADPYKDGRLPLYLEATELAVREVGDEVFVITLPAGPFTVASQLRGVDHFMLEVKREPERIHKLLDVCTQSIINFIDAIVKAGGVPCLAEPCASGSLISRKTFEDFDSIYLKRIVEHVHSYGLPALMHICGKAKPVMEPWLNTGPDLVSVDWPTDIGWFAENYGDRCAVLGNVVPSETIYLGTPEKVQEEARVCIEKGSKVKKGYILGSGCEVPVNSPFENVQALVDAARIYGQNWPRQA